MTSISRQRRLATLENRSENDSGLPDLIFSLFFVDENGKFGGKRCVSNHARENGGREWHRTQDETPDDFERRVTDILSKEPNGNSALVIFESDVFEDDLA